MYEKENVKEVEKEEKLNPWVKIWTKPRATVRSAIHHNSMKLALVLAIISGVSTAWDNAVSQNAGENYLMNFSLTGFIIGIIIIGAFIGFFTWLFVASAVTLVGRWLGGQGSVKELLIAIGISYIPLALLLCLNVIDLVILGENLFIDTYTTGGQVGWILFSGLIAIVVGVWSVFISLKAIGEAHRFSAWRALGALFIVVLMIIVVILFILFVVMAVF